MCVVILHHRTREDQPLLLLHNRDEAYDRPFDAPRLRDTSLGIVAPRDLQAGGTWLGLNRWGLVAALANRHGEDAVGGERSRGLVVADVLRAHRADDALAWVRGHLARVAYAGFHLLLADGGKAYLVRHRGAERPRGLAGDDVFEFFPGAYVITNLHEPGTVPLPEDAAPRPEEALEETVHRLERFAADEEIRLPGDHRILKRGRRRGTVCSALLAPPRFDFAAGPPDRAPFEAVPVLFGRREPGRG